ncbi:MAG: IS200/IS605 family transposase [Acidobacteria bacterium]|nr:IS200/IS605 family transposase [Acidobacteriota bacterium]
MPSTYFQLQYHLVFCTKNRCPAITDCLEPDLYAYLGGILRSLGGMALATGGIADHVHILAGLKPIHSVAAVMRELKAGSSQWLHEQKGLARFSWQTGYAAVTVSPSARDSVRRYIQTQREHHRRRSFRNELIELLGRSGITYDERFLD